ncbi:MAG: F0F1 ATP synthase subunit A [Alphaproteobacteria bacterium]|nr:F0F1 ATP synthase subunit A [Alphaproteobacteria bacterium]
MAGGSFDPMKQFQLHKLADLNIAGFDLALTNSALHALVGVLVASALLVFATRRLKLFPNRWQALSEWPYEFVHNLAQSNLGDKGKPFVPFLVTLFLFVLLGNLIGLLPYAFTYTSHISVTLTLALISIGVVIGTGFTKHGLGFFKLFLPSGAPLFIAPIIIPIEVVSFLAKPISLAIRLFANMLAGHIMIKVFAFFCTTSGFIAVFPLFGNVLIFAFELFVAFLQAYIFTLLVSVYLHDAIDLH